MKAIIIEAQNESDVKFWLNLAKKTGTRARSFKISSFEDKMLAELIEKGMNTKSVSRLRVMKALEQ